MKGVPRRIMTGKKYAAKDRKSHMTCLALCAVLTSLSMVLSMIRIIHMPFGGSITLFSMLACCLTGYFCGLKWGMISGVALGLLNMAFGGVLYYPLQILLDYILGFGVLGISGLLRSRRRGLQWGYLLAVTARFVCSFLSGVLFFGSFAPEGMSPVIYSFMYNILYIGGEALMTLLLLSVPSVQSALLRLKQEV